MGFLKKRSETNGFSVVNLLHQHIGGFEKARSMKYIHASSATKDDKPLCPREYALVEKLGLERPDEFVGTALRVTFQHGNNMQRMLNEEWIPDRMVGDWRCKACGDVVVLGVKPEGKTPGKDHLCVWEYQEPRAVSDYSGISCGIDGLIDVGKKLRLVETKTMDKDQFKVLEAPLAEHRIRTKLYLRIISEDPSLAEQINTEKATILYICKGYGFKADTPQLACGVKDMPFSPFKEFEIKANHASLDELSNLGREYKLWLAGGKMPKGICNAMNCGRAKKCLARKECFSGLHPAGI